jgi:hypothetical protein
MTMTDKDQPPWGNILTSNSNGAYFGLSIDHVNRDDLGYVDFEKMIRLDGLAAMNIVTDPRNSIHTGMKTLETRITHNDGGRFRVPLCSPHTHFHPATRYSIVTPPPGYAPMTAPGKLMAMPIADLGRSQNQDSSDAAAIAVAAGLSLEPPTEIPGVGNLASIKAEDARCSAKIQKKVCYTFRSENCPPTNYRQGS